MPTTPESRIKIQVNNLTKRFGDLTVLDGINFNIKEGELLAIVGPTGCGKTTFLNTLSKLMPATEGEILIDGEEANPKNLVCVSGTDLSALAYRPRKRGLRHGSQGRRQRRT